MSDARLWICQCLCPQRHCILALPYMDNACSAVEAVAALRNQINQMREQKLINSSCPLCHSHVLYYECSRTHFKSLEEALPHLNKLEADQCASAEYLRSTRN